MDYSQLNAFFNDPKVQALLIIIAIWDLAWRGVALWKAAQNKSKPWFVVLLILNTVGILPIVYIFYFAGKKAKKRRQSQRIMKQATLCLLIKDGEILLAMKKRGFGAGKWNGAGGKFDLEKGDENIMDAATRETKEEIGVEIKNPEKSGLFHFTFERKPEWNQDVTLFVVKEWQGEPSESEEMRPQWFDFAEIPYSRMWQDDILWMPHILHGKKLEADFLFGENDKILNYNLKIVENL